MQVFELTPEMAPLVAKMLARIKPEWFTTESALELITAPGIIGWYMGENIDTPIGCIHIQEHKPYNYIELILYGYDDNGEFHTGEKLAVLYDRVEQHALENGFRSVGSVLTHESEKITDYAEELSAYKPEGYLASRGHRPAGFIPDCYGVNLHGVIMLKHLYDTVSD